MVGVGSEWGEGKVSFCESFDFGWFWTLSRPYNGGVLSCSKAGFVISFMYIFLAHGNIGGVFLNIGGGYSNIGRGYSNKTSDF
jgi:hypothetical protein